MKKNTELSPFEIAKFIDANAYNDVVEFHAKTTYSTFNGLDPRCYLSSAIGANLERLMSTELKLNSGFKIDHLINKKSDADISLIRNKSAEDFNERTGVEFDVIERLLTNSFSAISGDSNRRPYPSGGALYPVEVFLCMTSKNIFGKPLSGSIFHYCPLSNGFEIISSEDENEVLDVISGYDETTLGHPQFAFVYTVFFDKAVVKYKNRGYRLALLEAGSMYQQADLCAKELGLKNRVWAGFTDYQVAKLLKVNPKHLMPLAVQFFGHDQ